MKRVVILAAMIASISATASPAWSEAQAGPEEWRARRRTIDLHQHIDCSTQHLARAVRIMDAVGIGVAVNLSGGTVTPGKQGEASEFEQNKSVTDALYPGRFVHYLNLDYSGWDEPDFAERAVKQVEEGRRLGAGGFKEFKRLGLYLRDGKGQLIKIDDPKLDPMWERCGELGMPVSIHVADPKAFWLPFDEKNERWKELKDHKSWWFGETNKYPAWKELLEALNRVIARHPKTTFVCVHFANNAEELDWVDQSLSRYPNMMADLAARLPEIGRHDPRNVRELFIKHQDRIFFATDFQVYDRLILGSSGNEPPPTDADAEAFFAKEWRWLETHDRNWAHMTPIQGDWTISSIGLPASVLRKIYFDNARKLLVRCLPSPVLEARHISQDFEINGSMAQPLWRTAQPVLLEQSSVDGTVVPGLSTPVRALWSAKYLYFAYECPYTRLTVFEPPQFERKRFNLERAGESLWDRDVIEAFIGADLAKPGHYAEFEVAPTNERLEVMISNLPEKDFNWRSGFQSAVQVDRKVKVWRCELRLPLSALADKPPISQTEWRLNLYRCDRAGQAALALRPVLTRSFHEPKRFGVLRFVE